MPHGPARQAHLLYAFRDTRHVLKRHLSVTRATYNRFRSHAVRFAVALLPIACLSVVTACGGARSPDRWPDWERFADRYLKADGRIVDRTFGGKTVSEGQAYALFFALVANQPERFDQILTWTNEVLAQGRLGEKLPDWYWGPLPDGGWGIWHETAATDADLWIAYALIEAGRLWNRPDHTALGNRILALVARLDVVEVGVAGPVLMPSPAGFVLDSDRYRVNPSYLPGFMFRFFAFHDPAGPWLSVWEAYLAQALTLFEAGIAPDLYIVSADGTLSHDTVQAPAGSYDAIRVYLWAGISGPESFSLLALLKPYGDLTRANGGPPDRVDPRDGKVLSDYSPPGFAAALVPYFETLGDAAMRDRMLRRLATQRWLQRLGKPAHYYDDALTLFGTGWLEQHYRFDPTGALVTAWSSAGDEPVAVRAAEPQN